MRRAHPGARALQRFMDGELPARQNRDIVQHLLEGCLDCQEVTSREWWDRLALTASTTADPESYRDSMAAAARRVQSRQLAIDKEQRQAHELLAELDRHPQPRRILLVSNSRRYRTPALCLLVLQRGNEERTAGADSTAWAELAIEIASRLDATEYGLALSEDLQARGWTNRAAAHRVLDEFADADRSIRTAREHLEKGTGDPLVEAFLCRHEGLIRGAERRFAEARGLFQRAIVLCRSVGDSQLTATALIDKATYLGVEGSRVRAIELLNQGLSLLDPERDERLGMVARHNLAVYLHEEGRHSEALAATREAARLHQRAGNHIDRVRLRWLEAKITQAAGSHAEAASAFLAVRERFVGMRRGYDAALVSLDLAVLYFDRGEHLKLRTMVAESLPIFTALGIHREAIAALTLLNRSIELEQVSVGLIREVAGYLERAQNNPELRFRPGS